MYLKGFEPKQTGSDTHDGKGGSWFTPMPVVRAVEQALGGISVDPCCHPVAPVWGVAKHRIALCEGGDGLVDRWEPGPAYVNPPYGDTAPWLRRAWMESRQGRHVIVLCRTSPSTNYWHDHVWMNGACVVQPRGRISFVGTDGVVHKGGQVVTSFVTWHPDIAVRLRRALLEHARMQSVVLRPMLWCEQAVETDSPPSPTAP